MILRRKHHELVRLLELIETQNKQINWLEQQLLESNRRTKLWIRVSARLATRLTREIQ
jgi:hypothetical protein